MAIMEAAGTERAKYLLNGIPARFTEFCHMDQITFVQLADWIVENAHSNVSPDISIEESLFIFLDIVAQGNSFKGTAYGWDHDILLTQSIFANILNALLVLREKEEISPSYPSFNMTKSRWNILRAVKRNKSRTDGLIKIGGEDNANGIEVEQEALVQALTALNNFIHEHRE